MSGDDFLDGVGKSVRPESNVQGHLDCQECDEPVDDGHYDRTKKILRWWCSKDHESIIKEVEL
jgi:hypothetical protein